MNKVVWWGGMLVSNEEASITKETVYKMYWPVWHAELNLYISVIDQTVSNTFCRLRKTNLNFILLTVVVVNELLMFEFSDSEEL